MYNNGTPIGTTVANSNGNWTFNNTGTALADGTYIFTATATDPNGNVSALSLPYGVTIDTTPPPPPAITGISPGLEVGTTLTTTSSSPTLFGTAQPYTQVTLYSGTYVVGTAAANGNGNWEFSYNSINPSVGIAYGITVRATDLAGNVSNSSATYLATVAYIPLVGTGRDRLEREPGGEQHPRHERRWLLQYDRHAHHHRDGDGELLGGGVRGRHHHRAGLRQLGGELVLHQPHADLGPSSAVVRGGELARHLRRRGRSHDHPGLIPAVLVP